MGGRLMGWSVGKPDLPPKTQSVLTAMCKIADDRHGRFYKEIHTFLREDVPSIHSKSALRNHFATLYGRGYIGRIRNGNRHKPSEFQIIATDVLPIGMLKEYEQIEHSRPRRTLPVQHPAPTLTDQLGRVNEGGRSTNLGVRPNEVGVSPSGHLERAGVSPSGHLERAGVSPSGHLERAGVSPSGHLEDASLLENTNHEKTNPERTLTSTTSKRSRGGSRGKRISSPGAFSSELLASLEAHGIFGFTGPGLAFADEYVPDFIRIRGKPPGMDDINYLAERAVQFIGRTGTDDSFRLQQYMRSVITAALQTGTTRITLRPSTPARQDVVDRANQIRETDWEKELEGSQYEYVDGKIKRKAI